VIRATRCHVRKRFVGLFLFADLGFIDLFGLLRDICHPVWGKGGTDNVPGQILNGLFLTRLYPWPTKILYCLGHHEPKEIFPRQWLASLCILYTESFGYQEL
jgi:hypothetical protein